jgi:hypothetical protein
MDELVSAIWGQLGLDRADYERLLVDTAVERREYARILASSQDAVGEIFDRLLADAYVSVGAPIIRTLVSWAGLLQLPAPPDPSRCSVCGDPMDEVRVWNSDRVVGYVCRRWNHDDPLRGIS